MKKIKLYSVSDGGELLTIVRNKKQAFEYAKKYLISKNYSHYSAWCELRNITLNDDSWYLYVKICGVPNDLEIKKGSLNLDLLVSSYRCVTRCLPLGMPWEVKEEMLEFLKSMPKEAMDEINTIIKEMQTEELPQ